MNSLRKISFDYFNEQIIISEKVNNEVQKLWLDGNEFSQIVKKIINTELMIKSVKQCKVFIINRINGETHKLEVFRTATGFNVYVDDSNICESITEEDFLQELENPTF